MNHTFHTTTPVELYVEIGSGNVHLDASDRDTIEVDVTGEGADDVTVEHRGDRVLVVGSHRLSGLFGRAGDVRIVVALPATSSVRTKLGSADLHATGTLGPVQHSGGSGDVRLAEVTGDCRLDSGSGDLTAGPVHGEVRISSGSGDIELGDVDEGAEVTTGSGGVRVGAVGGEVGIKTGSGSIRVEDCSSVVTLRTGSGSIEVRRARRGRLQARAGSGGIRVGVPAGLPVWTDVSTSSGRLQSDLDAVGEPAEGQDYLELLAKTGSGDVVLERC